MIDWHCHLLPGLDDGAKDWEESLLMASQLSALGYTKVCATVHQMTGVYDATRSEISDKSDQLNQRCQQAGIPIEIIPWAEVYLEENVVERLKNNEIPTWEKQVLVEGPFQDWPGYLDGMLFHIQTAGFVPVIAHPERNRVLAKDKKRIMAMREAGCKIQIDWPSLMGEFGPLAKQSALDWATNGLMDCLGTDLHRPIADLSSFKQFKQDVETKTKE